MENKDIGFREFFILLVDQLMLAPPLVQALLERILDALGAEENLAAGAANGKEKERR